MVYLKEGLRLGTVARVKQLSRLTKTVIEATIAYNTTEPRENKVRFVDHMYAKAETLRQGDVIAILMQYDSAEHVIYAYDFCKEGSYFLGPKNEIVIFSKPMKGEGTVRFHTKGTAFPFHEVELNKEIDTEKVSLCVAANGQMRMTPKGKSLVYYQECLAYGAFKIETNSSYASYNKDLMITVGVYENHPTKVSELLNVPENERTRVLEWMSFAADGWNPPNIGNLREQKAAITALLQEERSR